MAQVMTPAETVGANFFKYDKIKVFSVEVTKMDAVDKGLSDDTVILNLYGNSWKRIKYYICDNEITNCFEDIILKTYTYYYGWIVSQEDLPLLRALIAAQKTEFLR